MSAHPQALLLDRLWAGDLGGELRAEISTHASACADCRGYLGELSAESDAQLAALPPARFVEQLEGRIRLQGRKRRRSFAAGAAVVAALAASLLLVPQRSEDRFKGGQIAGLVVHRKRGEQVRRLEVGDRIRPGDSLRVSLSLAHPVPAGIWFVDAQGKVDPLFPSGPVEVRDGEQTLPGSVVVESPCVDLWVVAAGGPAAAGVEGALRRSLATRPPQGFDWLPKGAVVRRLECE